MFVNDVLMQKAGTFYFSNIKSANISPLMKISKLNIVLVLGLCAIAGILVMQILWTKQAFNVEEKKFSQKVTIGLLRTLERLYSLDNKE